MLDSTPSHPSTPPRRNDQHGTEKTPSPSLRSSPLNASLGRKPIVILSLPVAVAILITTSLYCLSISSSSSAYFSISPAWPFWTPIKPLDSSVAAVAPAANPQKGDAMEFLGHMKLSSSSWPLLPAMNLKSEADRIRLRQVVAQEAEQIQQERGQDQEMSSTFQVVEVFEMFEMVEGEPVYEVVILEQDRIEQEDGVEMMDLLSVEGLSMVPSFPSFLRKRHVKGTTVGQTTKAALTRRRVNEGTGDEGDEEEEMGEDVQEDEDEDEDKKDHFPSHMNDNNDDDRQDEGGQDDEEDKEGNQHHSHANKPHHGGGDGKDKHHHHQDENTNLGSTGGHGPILLCSSHSCLPALRDSILAKLSIQIKSVMDHLRRRDVLVHLMDSTAPQTKEYLLSGQEELVQQLEERVIKDLRDWVMGVGKKNTNNPVSGAGSGPRKSFKKIHHSLTTNTTNTSQQQESSSEQLKTPSSWSPILDDVEGEGPLTMNLGNSDTIDKEEMSDITVESEGLFLGGEEFEGEDNAGAIFRIASGVDLEDADDDDEDHEDDRPLVASTAKAPKGNKHTKGRNLAKKVNTKTPKKKIYVKRDTPSSSSSSSSPTDDSTSPPKEKEFFLSADKLLMAQEWSLWISHWVHHAKLLLISHTLATKTLTAMNQIAISGENVIPQDQRHWSWNLDKALATVMVASEMLCGGPSDPKDVVSFLSTLSLAPPVVEEEDEKVDETVMGKKKKVISILSSSPSLPISPKIMALTVNAQKCIEAWHADLEAILQKTASTV